MILCEAFDVAARRWDEEVARRQSEERHGVRSVPEDHDARAERRANELRMLTAVPAARAGRRWRLGEPVVV